MSVSSEQVIDQLQSLESQWAEFQRTEQSFSAKATTPLAARVKAETREELAKSVTPRSALQATTNLQATPAMASAGAEVARAVHAWRVKVKPK